MSTNNSIFAWKDRDTAARDLLAVARHAPPSVRLRALWLLRAIQSPVILTDLEEIVLDAQRNGEERRHALCAIASLPGDLFLPKLASVILNPNDSEAFNIGFSDFMSLARKHPSNWSWVFDVAQQYSPEKRLQKFINLQSQGFDNRVIVRDQGLPLIEQHPWLLNLDVVSSLYFRGKNEENIMAWLHERWHVLVLLCTTGKLRDSFSLLKDWQELRDAVFHAKPELVTSYNQYPLNEEEFRESIDRHRPEHKHVDYESSPVWNELNELYQHAVEGDRSAYYRLSGIVYHDTDTANAKRAVATYLFGKLEYNDDMRFYLFKALCDPVSRETAGVRLEAGEALCEIVEPAVWETMIDAVFIGPLPGFMKSYMQGWIEYQTNRLSGLEIIYTGPKLPLESERLWFRALAEPETSDDSTEA